MGAQHRNINSLHSADSHFKKFYDGFLKAFPAAAGIASLIGFFILGIYTYGSSQTANAAEIQKLKDGQNQINQTMQSKSDARDKQLEEIKRNMATRQDIENLSKQLQLGREDDKELRDRIYQILEKK